jgi:hypothetical protein
MEILLILFLLGLVIIVLYILYTVMKWIFQTKARAIGVFLSFLTVVVSLTIYQLFFLKLEFIQSKVYPDLYLVKNFPEDRSVLNQAIKDFVIKRIKVKTKNQHLDSNTSLRFYKYYKSYNPLVFGDSGTVYFIDNEEDLGGMVVEDLSMYFTFKLAVLYKTVCEDKTHYCAKLDFFEKDNIVKTDTINIIPRAESNHAN